MAKLKTTRLLAALFVLLTTTLSPSEANPKPQGIPTTCNYNGDAYSGTACGYHSGPGSMWSTSQNASSDWGASSGTYSYADAWAYCPYNLMSIQMNAGYGGSSVRISALDNTTAEWVSIVHVESDGTVDYNWNFPTCDMWGFGNGDEPF